MEKKIVITNIIKNNPEAKKELFNKLDGNKPKHTIVKDNKTKKIILITKFFLFLNLNVNNNSAATISIIKSKTFKNIPVMNYYLLTKDIY